MSMNRRGFLQLAGALSVAPGAHAAMEKAVPSPHPATFVLVHGAWTGGWVWHHVAAQLRRQGHEVYAPTCTGVGERAHLISPAIGLGTWIEDVSALLETEDLHQVHLVGSGFGGVVISGVADRARERIDSLIYFDALVIPDGSSAFDQFPPEVQERRRREIAASGDDSLLPAPPVRSFGLSSPAAIQRVAERLRPQPLRTYTDTLQLQSGVGNGLKRTYIDCTAPSFAPLVEVKQRLRQQEGWNWKELADSHDAMIENPDRVADLLASL
jgi:pimeloyl-ACP methyl ester carboxylesterase